jgi:SAM-dependent methyltransferase
MVTTDFYTSDVYLKNNPGWHIGASNWKAQSVLQMMRKHKINPKSVCEIGCGAGEILRILQRQLDPQCTFVGYDIAPQAIKLAQERENERLHFHLGEFVQESGNDTYDLILIVDVLEHFENCFRLLRDIKTKSTYKILQLPLDISALSVILNELIQYRHATGHLHFFTKDIALEILRDAGYNIRDAFYELQPFENPWSWPQALKRPKSIPLMLLKLLRRVLYRVPRLLLFAIQPDFAVRLLGGWRFLVLVE